MCNLPISTIYALILACKYILFYFLIKMFKIGPFPEFKKQWIYETIYLSVFHI